MAHPARAAASCGPRLDSFCYPAVTRRGVGVEQATLTPVWDSTAEASLLDVLAGVTSVFGSDPGVDVRSQERIALWEYLGLESGGQPAELSNLLPSNFEMRVQDIPPASDGRRKDGLQNTLQSGRGGDSRRTHFAGAGVVRRRESRSGRESHTRPVLSVPAVTIRLLSSLKVAAWT